jgi:FkbM family methyltransferase
MAASGCDQSSRRIFGGLRAVKTSKLWFNKERKPVSDVTPSDIQAGYRFILGRDPETQLDLVQSAAQFKDWGDLRTSLLNSSEAATTLYDAVMSRQQGWVRMPTYFGRQIYLCMSDTAVSRSIFLTGRWEPEIEIGILSRIRPDSVFLDVGANIGWFTLLVGDFIARANVGGQVIAIEANPSLVPYLSASVVDSGLINFVSIKPYAVSSNNGVVQMSASSTGNIGGFGVSKFLLNKSSTRNIIPTVTLDDLLVDLNRLDLVKMDIEGAEPLAIEGAVNLFNRLKPDVIMEINLSGLQSTCNRSVAEVIYQFKEMKYKVYNFRGLSTPQRIEIAEVEDIVSAHGYFDFLFQID